MQSCSEIQDRCVLCFTLEHCVREGQLIPRFSLHRVHFQWFELGILDDIVVSEVGHKIVMCVYCNFSYICCLTFDTQLAYSPESLSLCSTQY